MATSQPVVPVASPLWLKILGLPFAALGLAFLWRLSRPAATRFVFYLMRQDDGYDYFKRLMEEIAHTDDGKDFVKRLVAGAMVELNVEISTTASAVKHLQDFAHRAERQLDGFVEKIDEGFDRITKAVDRLDTHFDEIADRMTRVETQLDEREKDAGRNPDRRKRR